MVALSDDTAQNIKHLRSHILVPIVSIQAINTVLEDIQAKVMILLLFNA